VRSFSVIALVRRHRQPGVKMILDNAVLKVDLHVHSSHSDAPYSWFLRSAGAAECYTPIDQAYALARRRGMDLVTLADHDTIDGALELCARHDDTFVSVEVSARFPDDGCIVHMIALDVTEAQHDEMQRLRRNIYELTSYVEHAAIATFWCHPLSQVNGRLTRAHLEQCFLMFRALEVRNGTRDAAHELHLRDVSSRITPSLLEAWAQRHRAAPFINRDGRYALVGGSDDHGSLAIARAFTTFRGPRTGAGVAAAIRSGATEPGGESGTGTVLAHNCYGVLAGFLHASGQGDLAGPARDDGSPGEVSPSLLRSLIEVRAQPDKAKLAVERLGAIGHTDDHQALMRGVAERMLVDQWRTALHGVIDPATRGRVAEAADGVPGVLRTLALELPYLLAHRYVARDRRGAGRFAAELGARQLGRKRPRVAVFTDTIDDVNGVALGLRRVVAEARRNDLELHVVGCGPVPSLQVDGDGVVRLPSIYDHRLAEYPEMAWSVPHLPPLMRFLDEQQINLVQCSTPGPVGLAALAAARLAGIPVIGQYHTDVPEYALRLTGDPAVAALVREVVGWFYRAMDHVLVPSAWVGDLVQGLGVAADRLMRVPRGVDRALFKPERRRPDAFAAWGVTGPVILYVGRLSREKGLDHLLEAFRAVAPSAPCARLVLVGDGPLRAELERTAPPGCVFTGTVTGEALATLYASAHVFVFPSETETFGNAVVEAQASGVPVIVAATGATAEHVVDGVTGFAIDPRDTATMRRALLRLLEEPELHARMARAAATQSARHDLGEAVRGTFRCYARLLDEAAPRPRSVQRHERVA